MAEICDLHARLIANLRLGLSVFLNGDLKSAQELLAQKVLFRDLERAYADSHLRAPRREHAGQHRDVVAAPRSHLRLEAHQFPHLVDGRIRSSSRPAYWPRRASRSRKSCPRAVR